MAVYCSKKLKFFNYGTTIVACFLVLVVLKIAIWFFSTTITNALSEFLLGFWDS